MVSAPRLSRTVETGQGQVEVTEGGLALLDEGGEWERRRMRAVVGTRMESLESRSPFLKRKRDV